MALSNIQIDVFDRLSTLGDPIIYPNIYEAPPEVEHLRVDVMPNKTDTIGLNDTTMENGIVQVLVYSFHGKGAISASQKAESVLALFSRNTVLSSCRFDVTGSINTSFIDGSWYVTPVSLPYHNLS